MGFIFLKSEEIIDYVLKTKKSLIRWGDGESKIVNGRGIKFQEYSNQLKLDLVSIYKDYSNKSDYVLGIPIKGINSNVLHLINKPTDSKFIHKSIFTWYKSRYLFRNANKKLSYFDAFLFRDKQISKQDFIKIVEGKSLINISSKNRQFTNLQKLVQVPIRHIEIQAKNAYSQIENVIDSLNILIVKNNIAENNLVVLVHAGPAAKILIHRLANRTMLLLDIGSFDYMFNH